MPRNVRVPEVSNVPSTAPRSVNAIGLGASLLASALRDISAIAAAAIENIRFTPVPSRSLLRASLITSMGEVSYPSNHSRELATAAPSSSRRAGRHEDVKSGVTLRVDSSTGAVPCAGFVRRRRPSRGWPGAPSARTCASRPWRRRDRAAEAWNARPCRPTTTGCIPRRSRSRRRERLSLDERPQRKGPRKDR